MEDTRHIRLYLNPAHSFDFAATDQFFLLDMHEGHFPTLLLNDHLRLHTIKL